MELKARQKLAFMLSAVLVLATACSNGGESSKSNTNAPAETKVEPLGKYDPPIEITTVRQMHPSMKFASGESIDKNSVYDAYEKDLGIKLKNKWTTADAAQYDAKVKIDIASNDIADLMLVPSASELQSLIEADMITDLTKLYDKYATPETKKFLSADGGKQLETATFNGKLMAIPNQGTPYSNGEMIWVRTDWLKKLNLQAPKSMQDVIKISEAFTNGDPDGNGKKDTFGVGLQKAFLPQASLAYAPASVSAIMFGHHAYPRGWVKQKDGTIGYGSVQPEIKTALKTLQDMFKSGQLDPEFGVKDGQKVTELIANNRVGMVFGNFNTGAALLRNGVVKDGKPTQEWDVFPLVSADSQKPKTLSGLGTAGYFVVSKKSKNPEAAIKLLNRYVKSFIAGGGTAKDQEEWKYFKSPNIPFDDPTNTYYLFNPMNLNSIDVLIVSAESVPQAVASKDPSKLPNTTAERQYNNTMKYLTSGDGANWHNWLNFKENGAFPILAKYAKEDGYLLDVYTGPKTQTMVDKNATLTKKEEEIFTKIIYGQASIDEFDKFVTEWKSLGGEQMTKEVNDWYKKRGGK